MIDATMPREVSADPEVTAEQVRRALESMGKYRELLRTIAAAPRPAATQGPEGLEVCRSGELVTIVRRRGGRTIDVLQVAGKD